MLWEPLPLSSLAASPAVRNQPFPASSFRSRYVWCSCRDGESSQTSSQSGDLICWHQILNIQPPPYITPPILFPLSCSPAAEKHWTAAWTTAQTTLLSQLTKHNTIPLSTLKVQNSYSRWHLLPINQHSYKHWAFFCLAPSTSRSLQVNQRWLYTISALHIFFLLHILFLLLLQPKKLLSAAPTSSLTLSLTCSFLSLRHLSHCMWHKTDFRNIF